MLSNWWPARRDPTTPKAHVYFTASKSTKRRPKRQLADNISLVKLPSRPLPSASHLISAWDLLSRPFAHGPIVRHSASSRATNKTAVAAGYDKATIDYEAWDSIFPPKLRQAYLEGIQARDLQVADISPQTRIIDTEGDIGDTMLTNAILPAINVLNELIHPELKADLVIVPSSERTKTFEFFHGKQLKDASISPLITASF
ncbi:uncharacterized protein JCM6883_007647 [Sporobolomyces salmoneus]|uniref:uncharacterized protein n=1 Tax=Sporobolomyces salmoneus TaxID=183962 RepID=UPI00316C7DAA